ncbi:MAG: hypothetical protein PHF56_15555 [Desulfuromonadaceae bacterium]|nr:hypothetical protein [Desulfuromonadaceae bacterium]
MKADLWATRPYFKYIAATKKRGFACPLSVNKRPICAGVNQSKKVTFPLNRGVVPGDPFFFRGKFYRTALLPADSYLIRHKGADLPFERALNVDQLHFIAGSFSRK